MTSWRTASEIPRRIHSHALDFVQQWWLALSAPVPFRQQGVGATMCARLPHDLELGA